MAQEVRAVVWQSEGCRFDPTLGVSQCPWARHLTPNCSWQAGWYLAWQPIAVGVWMCVWMCVNGWMRAINCTALWIKALYKCSPFTIQFPPMLCVLGVFHVVHSRVKDSIHRFRRVFSYNGLVDKEMSVIGSALLHEISLAHSRWV